MESDVSQSAVFYKAYAWADAHKKQLLLFFLALVAVAIGITAFMWNENRKESAANAALSAVTAAAATGDMTAASPDALAKVGVDHAGTDAAARAVLLAGAGYFAQGKYADAKAQFEKYLREYRDSTFASQALMGSAASVEALGDLEAAATAYSDIGARHPGEFVGIQAKLALGRVYEAQSKWTLARDAYEEVMRSGVPGTVVSQAGAAYQVLLANHPELAQPRETPTPAQIGAPLVRPTNTNAIPIMSPSSAPATP